MILRLDEIPPEGKKLEFELELEKFNARLSGDKDLVGPAPVVNVAPKAELLAEISGVTVFLKGRGAFEAESLCSRCSEIATVKIDTPISMVLKPKGKSEDDVEDLALGFYQGKEFEVNPIVEEQLILSLPYKILCKDECLGLCPSCGENLNFEQHCRCSDELKSSGPDSAEKNGKDGKFLPFEELKAKVKF